MPDIKKIKNDMDDKTLLFLNQINSTNIDNISDINIDFDHLKKAYNFLIFFMKSHIHSMNNIKGLGEIEKIYNEQ